MTVGMLPARACLASGPWRDLDVGRKRVTTAYGQLESAGLLRRFRGKALSYVSRAVQDRHLPGAVRFPAKPMFSMNLFLT